MCICSFPALQDCAQIDAFPRSQMTVRFSFAFGTVFFFFFASMFLAPVEGFLSQPFGPQPFCITNCSRCKLCVLVDCGLVAAPSIFFVWIFCSAFNFFAIWIIQQNRQRTSVLNFTTAACAEKLEWKRRISSATAYVILTRARTQIFHIVTYTFYIQLKNTTATCREYRLKSDTPLSKLSFAKLILRVRQPALTNAQSNRRNGNSWRRG